MNRRGVTLMELLVAVIITGIVVWIASRMFGQEKSNYYKTREKVKLQADSRDAMRILEEDLRNVGFKVGMKDISTPYAPIRGDCPDINALPDSSSFLFQDGVAGSGATASDKIGVGYYTANDDGTIDCSKGDSIAYRVTSNHVLERLYRPLHATSTPNWIPLLENVLTFQVEYGLDAAGSTPWATSFAATSPSASGEWSSASIPTYVSPGNTDFSGFSSTTKTWATTTNTLEALSTYLVSFKVTPRDGMLTKYDLSPAGHMTANNFLKVGFQSGGSWIGNDSISFYPGQEEGEAREVVTEFSTGTTAVSGARFVLQGKTSLPGSGVGTLRLSNIEVRKISGGTYNWINSPTLLAASKYEKNRVKALRLTLVTSTDRNNKEAVRTLTGIANFNTNGNWTPTDTKSYIVLRRVIPVVNNGK